MKARIPKDKYFYVKTAEEMVELMKPSVIAALNLTMDQLFEAINKEGYDYNEVKEDEPPMIENYRGSINIYQTLVNKLKDGEELTAFDYDSIVLICQNTAILFEAQAKSLREGASELSKIAWKIAHLNLNTSKSTEVLQQTKNLTKTEN